MRGPTPESRDPGRRSPAQNIFVSLHQPTIVFLTVCTKGRQPWLAASPVHNALVDVWKRAEAWLVGYYILMPDHLHLFCAPHDLNFKMETWVAYWKRQFSCLHLPDTGQWLRKSWPTRLLRSESYSQKWTYVRENPVRKGLVEDPDDWPYQGMINELRW